MDEEVIQELMKTISTKSKTTLALWGLDYATKYYLPLDKEDSTLLLETIPLIEEWIYHQKKPDLKEIRSKAGKIKDFKRQITYRAVITAFAIYNTPTNALGFLLYGCMAIAYSKKENLSQEEYDIIALQELEHALSSLKDSCKENEEKPVKTSWNC